MLYTVNILLIKWWIILYNIINHLNYHLEKNLWKLLTIQYQACLFNLIKWKLKQTQNIMLWNTESSNTKFGQKLPPLNPHFFLNSYEKINEVLTSKKIGQKLPPGAGQLDFSPFPPTEWAWDKVWYHMLYIWYHTRPHNASLLIANHPIVNLAYMKVHSIIKRE